MSHPAGLSWATSWKAAAAVVLLCGVAMGQGKAGPSASKLQRDIDPELRKAIDAVQAFDNHAHPVLPPPADLADRGFDALPVDNMAPQTDPVAWRPDNPQLNAAWKALWGFTGTAPLDENGMRALQTARARVKERVKSNLSLPGVRG